MIREGRCQLWKGRKRSKSTRLRVRQATILSCFVGLMVCPPGGQSNPAGASEIWAKVRLAQEKYCRADADLFTVSLKLEVDVSNSSTEVVFLPPRMIPWVAKVAASVRDAKSGHFLYEITASHYPLDSPPGAKVRVNQGKTVTIHTGYDLIAKYDPAFPYPKALHAGSYAIIFVLAPEMVQPSASEVPEVLESLATDPFLIRIPEHPNVTDCETPADLGSTPNN